MNDDLKESILSIVEASLDAQLRAVRRLRQGGQVAPRPSRRKGLSQIDMAYDVLKKARSPLHVSELLARIHSSLGVAVARECRPPLPVASPSIARASSLPSPRRSPARTASCAPTRIPSPCVRRPDDSAGRLLGDCGRLALGLSSSA